MLIGLIAIGVLLYEPLLGLYIEIFPVMVVFGPLMVLQVDYCRRQCVTNARCGNTFTPSRRAAHLQSDRCSVP